MIDGVGTAGMSPREEHLAGSLPVTGRPFSRVQSGDAFRQQGGDPATPFKFLINV